jgi:hypothetical protein
LLKISLHATEEELADYEWIEEGKIYREWLLPAELLNSSSTIEMVRDGD